jgi:four helix bundle protein
LSVASCQLPVENAGLFLLEYFAKEHAVAARHYRELIVRQKSMDLVTLIYKVSRAFPREEVFGLTAQLRRAAVSIPSNIAEGQGRGSVKDFLHFLAVARGSLQEVETQLIISQRLGYAEAEELDQILAVSAEVSRLLHGLRASLKPES